MSTTEGTKYPKAVLLDSDLTIFKGLAGEPLTRQLSIDGFLFPTHQMEQGLIPDFRRNIPAIQNMEMRDDDVLICAHPKAGTHWLWEMTMMLVKGKAEYELLRKSESMLEFNETDHYEHMERPRVLNTHLSVYHLPRQILSEKGKILFIQRNPKDVVVSYFNHLRQVVPKMEGKWDDFLALFVDGCSNFGPWQEYTKGYEKLMSGTKNNVLSIYYEDLKRAPVPELKRIAGFLEVDVDDSLAREIVEKCSFQNMKNACSEKYVNDKKGPDTVFRKGDIGDWKNWFTVAQNEVFDDMMDKKMKGCTFQYTYT